MESFYWISLTFYDKVKIRGKIKIINHVSHRKYHKSTYDFSSKCLHINRIEAFSFGKLHCTSNIHIGITSTNEK